MQEDKDRVMSIIKEYASPVLLSIIGMLIWRDLSELRTDVKLLLIQQNRDSVKISLLESDVNELKKGAVELERLKITVETYHRRDP